MMPLLGVFHLFMGASPLTGSSIEAVVCARKLDSTAPLVDDPLLNAV